MKTVGKVAKSGSWLRSQQTNVHGSIINKLSTNSWIYSKSTKNGVHYNYKSDSGDNSNLSLFPQNNEWRIETTIDGTKDIVEYSKKSNRLHVSHDAIINKTGHISSNGQRVTF